MRIANSAERGIAAVEDLREACDAAGLTVTTAPPDAMFDLCLVLDDRVVPIEVKALGLATGPVVASLAAGHRRSPPGGITVVVADRVVASARELLTQPGWGWLDRRGRLVLRGPGVIVDTRIPRTYEQPSPGDPLASQVGREVAVALLLDVAPGSGRGLARILTRSAGAVATALGGLRSAGLIGEESGAPVLPDLFWALADRWPTGATPLAQRPEPGRGRDNAALALGVEDVEATQGWAVTDTLAAAAYGAPVAIGSAYPPDFVVPTTRHMARAQRLLGSAEYADRAATVRVAAVPWMCSRRVDAAERGLADTEWPLTQPLFVALDLATDPGRGREILDDWTPPAPWRRVW